MTDAEGYFQNGGEYPSDQCSDIPRPKCCWTCAFIQSPASVRTPVGMTIWDVEVATALYDDFICHERCDDGLFHTCAGWAARFLGDGS